MLNIALCGRFQPGRLGTLTVVCILVSAPAGCALFEKPVATIATDTLPRELDKVSLPPYIVEPPDILVIESQATVEGVPLAGQFLVRPDGTVSLGGYGSIYVAGNTLEEVKQKVFEKLSPRVEGLFPLDIYVDVLAYNSKVYYVITDGAGAGAQVTSLPATGNETVLDALSQIGGLSALSSKERVWIARPTPDTTQQQIIPVDWRGIVEQGVTETNYQIMPGDRVYVKADPLIALDILIGRLTAPVERVLGSVLLWDITIQRFEGGGGGRRNTFP